MTSVLSPVRFDAPLVNPAPGGLFYATQWQDTEAPPRWLPAGVEVRPFNYGLDVAGFGVWAADWDAVHSELDPEDDAKRPGERPQALPVFAAITTWAADESDATAASQAEVRLRVQQICRLKEPLAVEVEFAARMLDDAGTPDTAEDIVGAVAHLESLFADANTTGFVHASPMWAASVAQANLLVRTGAGFTTPLGHRWVFGGGYKAPLGDTLVATSQPFGWRGPVSAWEGFPPEQMNRFRAIAERSLVVGYEATVGAVTVS
ncbi:hypothetical protein L2K20_06115 [Mycobacterium sp. MBM]|nr:hypothetical protein [Mycobacterium sp. MBM]